MSPAAARRAALRSGAAGAVQTILLAGSAVPALAAPTRAQEPEAQSPEFWNDLWMRDYLLGFGPRRERWEERGINVDLFYNAYFGWNAKGGLNTGSALAYSHSVDLFVRADTERMGLWANGTVLIQLKSNYGKSINPDVGALSQANDDADFEELIYVDQFYYEHDLREHDVRLRVGYLDYQTIIDRNAYANSEDLNFMNAALDNNPLVPLKIGFGATVFLEPAPWMGVILGTADAENDILQAGWDTAFDGENLMAYGEVRFTAECDSARGGLLGHYRWGVFYDPRSQPVFGQVQRTTGTVGTWLSLDQMVYREGESDRQGLGMFYRYGYREKQSYATTELHSAGLEYVGLLPNRDEDAFGIGFYDLVSSDDYLAFVDSGFGGEAGFESYYRYQLTPWLAITPSVQYIENPGGMDSSPDALAFLLRLRSRL